MFILSVLLLIGSFLWLIFEPGWEPTLLVISSLTALLGTESHVKNWVGNTIEKIRAKKLTISEGELDVDYQELLKIMRDLALAKDIKFILSNRQNDELERHAKKNEKDENQKYYILSQVQRSNERLELVEYGIRQMAALYRKRLLQFQVQKLPNAINRFVSLVYPPNPSDAKFIAKTKETPFDIYTNSVVKGEISFIADLPENAVKRMLKSLELNSTQEMCLPYFIPVLKIPDDIVVEYIIPALVFSGRTKFEKLEKSDNFWVIHNWYIGPH